MNLPSPIPVAGVVVTYLPGPEVFDRLGALAPQVARVVVVDNGSSPEMQAHLGEWLRERGGELIRNRENLGLAAALNQAMARVEELGFPWAVTLDQDSSPQAGMVAALLATAGAGPEPGGVAMVGARIVEEKHPNRHQRWLMRARHRIGYGFETCEHEDLRGVTLLLTSGALTRVNCWRSVGGFFDGLFIDYVDYDFCLRVLLAGLEMRVSASAVLLHNLGERRRRRFFGRDFLPTFHSPTRHYYMMRNRVYMWRRYAWRVPHWCLFDIGGSGKSLLMAFLLEDQRKAKLSSAMRGLWDGLRGRMGPMPRS